MKYLCLAYYDEKKFEALPNAELQAMVSQCPAYDQALRRTGRLFAQASLGESKSSVCLRPRKDEVSVTDGPFTETKEQVGGFFIIEAADRDEAIRIASNHPAAHLGEQVGWGIEVRPIEFFDQP
jgi:hypothetical protein